MKNVNIIRAYSTEEWGINKNIFNDELILNNFCQDIANAWIEYMQSLRMGCMYTQTDFKQFHDKFIKQLEKAIKQQYDRNFKI